MKTIAVNSRSFEMLATLLAAGAMLAAVMHATPASADVALGKAQFAACAACHSTSGSEGIGPHLDGVFGRKAGSVAGFSYSPAMKQSNTTWNEQTLAAYLSDPQKAIPGNRMPFAGLPDATQVANLVDYLKSLH